MLPALTSQAFDAGLPPIEESSAYRQFSERPHSDLSALIYLIDRFKESRIVIVYDGFQVEAPLAARMAKSFLQGHYKNERPYEWIIRWCNTAVPSGKLIWVRDKKGNFLLSREILVKELRRLESACQSDPRFDSEPAGRKKCGFL